jgi:hypothetical protein
LLLGSGGGWCSRLDRTLLDPDIISCFPMLVYTQYSSDVFIFYVLL